MKRIDERGIKSNSREVRLFMVGADAAHLIPYLIEYYFALGIDRIFYIDNDSNDNSINILLQFDSVHIFSEKDIYGSNNTYGVDWQRKLLKRYGIGHWCLLADTDELFVFPDCENRSIRNFIEVQEDNGFDCVRASVIDMYSNMALIDTKINVSLHHTCPYFDKKFPGCRTRVLNFNGCYRKIPLFYCRENSYVYSGFHHLANYNRISNIYCGILHFKWISNFLGYLNIRGKNLWEDDKKLYDEKIDGSTNFYCDEMSTNYTGTQKLVELGLISNWEGNNLLQKEIIEHEKKMVEFYEKHPTFHTTPELHP